MNNFDPVELAIFVSRVEAVCEEMGIVLQRAAFSPNIKDRLDYSCALFDANGDLFAQAAHIPVHLGSMAYAMRDLVASFDWQSGDMLILNDPFLGGTHLPDVTLVAPLFVNGTLTAFVANRAHHANIGSDSPGSMPVSRTLKEEGLVISPSFLLRSGNWQTPVLQQLQALVAEGSDQPNWTLEARVPADVQAQVAANRVGLQRLLSLIEGLGIAEFQAAVTSLNQYGESLARATLRQLPKGRYFFTDYLDDDGAGTEAIPICLALHIGEDAVTADFAGTSPQVAGNVNCPLSVTAAVAYYVFRCLMPPQTPACAGAFRFLSLSASKGSLVNAQSPAAVAAGNVETSQRLVDVFLGALSQAMSSLPAASQGSMNNIAMGSHHQGLRWDYYETIGGGMGASRDQDGLSAVQTHMTNTLNTPIESLEMHYPLRIRRYEIRPDSGGRGYRSGGNGILREYEFLDAATVTLLTERRRFAPWGAQGGPDAIAGRNRLNGQDLPSKVKLVVNAGDRLCVETAGGGGWGEPN